MNPSPSERSDWRVYRVVFASALMVTVEVGVWVTVMLYAYERGGASAAGLATGLSLLPAAILAPLLGSVGDRFPRGTALAGAYLVTAIIVATLAFLLYNDASLVAIVVCAGAVTVTISVARPIHYASLPQLSSTPQALVWANSATAFAGGIGAFAGPTLAGLAAATIGSWALAAASAVAMLCSTALCIRLHLPVSAEESEGPLREALAGLRHVGSDVSVLALLALSGAVYIVTGALEILGVDYVAEVLGGDEAAQGLLVGGVGLGSLAGALLGASLAFRRRLAPPLVWGLVASSLPLIAVSGVRALIPAVALVAVFGLAERFSALASETLMQRATDDAVLARVFAVWEAVMLLGYAIGTIGVPYLIGWFGPAGAYVPLGLGLAILALAAWPLLRALDDRALFRTDVLALFRGISFLKPMRPAALDRLSNTADWEDWEPGGVVIEQHTEGDSYYIVESGSLEVAVDGKVQRTLTAGDGFGEVGLLLDMPRSGTVTVMEPTRLLVVDRDDFLAAVTRSPDGRRIAMRVAAAHVGHPAGGNRGGARPAV